MGRLIEMATLTTYGKIYRVIDDTTRVMTTLDPEKALMKLQKVLEKHKIDYVWVDVEEIE